MNNLQFAQNITIRKFNGNCKPTMAKYSLSIIQENKYELNYYIKNEIILFLFLKGQINYVIKFINHK